MLLMAKRSIAHRLLGCPAPRLVNQDQALRLLFYDRYTMMKKLALLTSDERQFSSRACRKVAQHSDMPI